MLLFVIAYSFIVLISGFVSCVGEDS